MLHSNNDSLLCIAAMTVYCCVVNTKTILLWVFTVLQMPRTILLTFKACPLLPVMGRCAPHKTLDSYSDSDNSIGCSHGLTRWPST